MSNQRSRQLFTLLLVFGAMVFGMVLAGGIDITTPSVGAPDQREAEPVAAATAGYAGLPNFAELVERVGPAVVSIEARAFERAERRGRDPFEFFFPRRRSPREDGQEFRSDSGGSGFIISEDGLVVTNNHVVDKADELLVHLGDETFEAEIVGVDPATDLALLRIDPGRPLPYLALGDSEALRVGEWVMAVGSPLGLTDTVTVGVVSAKDRRINITSDTSFENFIQTDAAINFGNSGGPLIDLSGRVVGINTAINFGSENIGFAVPVDTLQQILPQLRDSGRVRRGYLGIGVDDLDQEAAEAFGVDSTEGVMVVNVQPDLPADRAGIKHGDILLEVDGHRIENTRDLIDHVSSRGPDATVELKVYRDGETFGIEVELAERPSDQEEEGDEPDERRGGIEWLGLRYQDLSSGVRSMHSLPDDVEGIWITAVSPRSPLYDDGVRTDSVINIITEVNGREVGSVAEFERAVEAARSGSRLRIYVRRFSRGREGQPLWAFPSVP